MQRAVGDTHHKALELNLESSIYGAFAEIGAGQEVARWFFRVGGASGTISKTISAYDMTVSDAIYGPAVRYVSRQRLQTMLDYEFNLMLERLDQARGHRTRFFVFANTVTARSYQQVNECHGWMGVRFQTEPRSPTSEIIIHVRMLDRENLLQQEALGILGVNLIHGAFHQHQDPVALIRSLVDGLTTERVEVDLIKFSGKAFVGTDPRLMSLELVRQGLANAAMFTAEGEVVQAAEVLYKRPILLERGRFRPVTKTTLEMLELAHAEFAQLAAVQVKETVILMEMTLKSLSAEGGIDYKDFLDRADLLGSLGKTVLISNYVEFYRLAAFLFRYTNEPIGLVMGVQTLQDLLEEKHYGLLEGGILESLGRLFKNQLRLYVYPWLNPATGHLTTAGSLLVEPHLSHLYAYLLDNLFIQDLRGYTADYLPIRAKDVLAKLRRGDGAWAEMVPPQVAALMRARRLFGSPGPDES